MSENDDDPFAPPAQQPPSCYIHPRCPSSPGWKITSNSSASARIGKRNPGGPHHLHHHGLHRPGESPDPARGGHASGGGDGGHLHLGGVRQLHDGHLARYPIALAPGMGLNAYFTYTVVKGMGIPWQAALGAVFVSGVAFLILTALGIRQLIVAAIPFELYAAVAAGVGLFIAFIGFRNAGLIAPHPATLVTLGNLRDPHTLLAVFGLLATSALLARRVPAAMLIGILLTTASESPPAWCVASAALQLPRPLGDRAEAGRGRDAAAGLLRDRFRVPVHRHVRQYRNAGGGGQARGPVQPRHT
jgi:hypothetical protein